MSLTVFGAGGRTRTGTVSPPVDFESTTSANSITPACVKRLNDKLQQSHSFEGKAISLNLRESGIDEWKGDMTISLDGIPLENSGFGTQNMFKSEIFLLQNSDVDILIIEEPENNLSYANMSILISKLSESTGKQLFISTAYYYVIYHAKQKIASE